MWAAQSLSSSLLVVALLPVLSGVSAQRGGSLYDGKEALHARIREHDDLLPPESVRCANCHSAPKNARFVVKQAPRLDSAWLLQARQRRGGPPTAYDEISFCKVLRSGVDPGHVLIDREMPVYNVDEEQCASLWAFVSTREALDEKPNENR